MARDPGGVRDSSEVRAQFGGTRPLEHPRKLQTESSRYLYISQKARVGAQAPTVGGKSGEREKVHSAPEARTNFRVDPQFRRGANSRTPRNAETEYALRTSPQKRISPKVRDGAHIALAGKKLTATLQRKCTSREHNTRSMQGSLRAVAHFEGSRPSEHAGQRQSRRAPRWRRPPRAHDPRAMWGSLIVGVRSEMSRPSGHAEKPRSGGAFRGFATHGGFGAASVWGAFRGFATLGARETASEWGRVSMARDPRTQRKDPEPGRVSRVRDLQRMKDSLIAGARFRGTRSSERAG